MPPPDPTRTDEAAATGSIAEPVVSTAGGGAPPVPSPAPELGTAAAPDGPPVFASPPPSAERYALGEEIARGGMGTVYRATDTVLNREVAVKVVQARYGPESGVARRFADEARITAQLQHPAIPPVHDLGTLPDGRPFLAMKLIKGETLHGHLEGRTNLGEGRGRVVAVFEQVCQAVGYAHAHDVIHRDLKPANVMVGAFGEVQVMDWGLAKVLGERPRVSGPSDATAPATEIRSRRESDAETQAGSLIGTPAFMPPEQAIGAIDQIDRRSDVFGLGGILAAILTGRPPFVGENAESTRQLAAKGKVVDCFARLDASGADPEWIALCKRCLSPEKDDRPADGGEVAKAVAGLRAAADERARQAERERAAAEVRAAEQAKRRRAMQWAGGVVAAVLLAGTGVSLWQASEARAAKKVADEKADIAISAEAATAAQLLKTQQAEAATAAQLAKTQQAEAATAAQLAISRERTKLLSDAYGEFVFGIQHKLKDQPGTQDLRRSLLEVARTGLKKILDDARAHGAPDQTLVWSHFRMGDVEKDLGNFPAAQKEYQAGHELANSLADADPTNVQARRDLSISFEKLGDLALKQGQPKAALAFHQKGLEVVQKLADADPANLGHQVDLIRTLGAVGDAALKLGQPEAALDSYRKATNARQKIADAAANPKSRWLQHELSLGYRRLGDVEAQLRQRKAALDNYQKALDGFQKLADAEPTNAGYQSDLSLTLGRVGGETLVLGQPKAALVFYRKATDGFEKLADADPKDVTVQNNLLVSYFQLGYGLMTVHEYTEAATWLTKADQLLKEFQKKGLFTKPNEQQLGTVGIRQWQAIIDQQLKTCRNAEKALADLDVVLRQPANAVPGLLDTRVAAFASKNDLKNLVSTAAAYEKLATRDDHHCYNAACAWSRASGVAKDDAEGREEYAGKALALLRKSPARKGYFVDTPAKLAAHMKQDTDLDPLRERADYKAFVAALATATSQPPRELAPPPRAVKR